MLFLAKLYGSIGTRKENIMENFIYGLNPVISALKGKRRPKKVLISETLKNKDVEKLCKEMVYLFNFLLEKSLIE